VRVQVVVRSVGTWDHAMMGKKKGSKKYKKESTKKREAYFINYARKIHEFIQTPLMVTGGFRNKEIAQSALQSGHLDIVGFARPLAVYPDLAKKLLENPSYEIEITEKKLGIKSLDSVIPLEITWYTQQIHRLGKNKNPLPKRNVWLAAFLTICELGIDGIKRTRA